MLLCAFLHVAVALCFLPPSASVSSRLTLDVRVRVRLQRAIEQMQKEITGQQSEITRLEGVIHDLKRDHPHAAAPPPPGTTLRPICYAHGLY